MSAHEVRCINKPDPGSPFEEITHLGDGVNYWWTREEVVRRIETGGETFFSLDPATGAHIDLRVVREPGRPPYLKSCPDGPLGDHLLALPLCARWHPHAPHPR